MDYKKHYDLLISTRKNMNRSKRKNDGFHNHHIIPKSLGGDNSHENLVSLTPKEHFIAHLLLMMMYKNVDFHKYRKMVYAFWNMCGGRNKLKTPNSRSYTLALESKRLLSVWVKKENEQKFISSNELEKFLGKGWSVGRLPHSEETKLSISNTRSGKTWVNKGDLQKQVDVEDLKNYVSNGWEEGRLSFTKTHKVNIKENLRGRSLSLEHRNNIGNSVRGKKIKNWSDERKKQTAKPIVFFGVKYDGLTWAAKALNKSKSWVFNMLKDEKVIDCYYL